MYLFFIRKYILNCIYIKDGKILDQEPEKILREKKPDKKYLATLHYDNTPPFQNDAGRTQ